MFQTDRMIKGLPFTLGTTSYILPDEILPNAPFLAETCAGALSKKEPQ